MQEVVEILEFELGLEPKIVGNVVKAHTKTIGSGTISILNDLLMSDTLGIDTIDIKRSGTGMTIIVTLED